MHRAPFAELGGTNQRTSGCDDDQQADRELAAVRRSIKRDSPFGDSTWTEFTAQ